MPTMLEIARRIRKEAEKEHRYELGIGGRDQEMMLQTWQEIRPRMYKALKRLRVEKLLARLLEERAFEDLPKAWEKMPPTDAREETQKAWYLADPEEDSEVPEETLDAVMSRVEAMGNQP